MVGLHFLRLIDALKNYIGVTLFTLWLFELEYLVGFAILRRNNRVWKLSLAQFTIDYSPLKRVSSC